MIDWILMILNGSKTMKREREKKIYVAVVQLEERFPAKEEVSRSNRLGRTT